MPAARPVILKLFNGILAVIDVCPSLAIDDVMADAISLIVVLNLADSINVPDTTGNDEAGGV